MGPFLFRRQWNAWPELMGNFFQVVRVEAVWKRWDQLLHTLEAKQDIGANTVSLRKLTTCLCLFKVWPIKRSISITQEHVRDIHLQDPHLRPAQLESLGWCSIICFNKFSGWFESSQFEKHGVSQPYEFGFFPTNIKHLHSAHKDLNFETIIQLHLKEINNLPNTQKSENQGYRWMDP